MAGSTYEFDYSLMSDNATPSSTSANFQEDVTSFHNVGGLNQLTLYKASIRRKCGLDSSGWKTISNIETLPTCPKPTAFSTNRIQPDSIYLSATLARPSVGSIQIEYGKESSHTVGSGTFLTNPTVVDSMSGLTAYKLYKISIRQVCSSGDTSRWKTIEVRTLPNMISEFSDKFEDNDGNGTEYFSTLSTSVRKWKIREGLARSGDTALRLAPYQHNSRETVELNYFLDMSDDSKYQFLTFWHVCATQTGRPGAGRIIYDYGEVQVSTDSGKTYTTLPASTYYGKADYAVSNAKFHETSYPSRLWQTLNFSNMMFRKETFNLSQYAGAGKTLRLRFKLKSSNGTIRNEGWSIDDVKFQQVTCPLPVNIKAFFSDTYDSLFIMGQHHFCYK